MTRKSNPIDTMELHDQSDDFQGGFRAGQFAHAIESGALPIGPLSVEPQYVEFIENMAERKGCECTSLPLEDGQTDITIAAAPRALPADDVGEIRQWIINLVRSHYDPWRELEVDDGTSEIADKILMHISRETARLTARVVWLESLFKFEDDDVVRTAPNDPVTKGMVVTTVEYHSEAIHQRHSLQAALAEARGLVGQKSEQYAEERAKGERLAKALKRAERLCTNALPEFNWGSSALSADAIALLNEVPGEIVRALEQSR